MHKTPGVIWLQHEWVISDAKAIRFLRWPERVISDAKAMTGMLCMLRTHKTMLNGRRQLILLTWIGNQMDGMAGGAHESKLQ